MVLLDCCLNPLVHCGGNTAPRAAWTELAIMVLRVVGVVVGLVELIGGVPVEDVLEEVVVIFL